MKKHAILLFIHFSLCVVAISQRQEADSLLKVLPHLNDTSRIDCLAKLCWFYIRNLKRDSATYYSSILHEESTKIKNTRGIALSFYYKSQIAKFFDDDFSQSEVLAKEALYWFEKTDNKKGIDEILSILCINAFAQSRYEEAILYAEKNYEWQRLSGNKPGMLENLGLIGAIYKEAGEYEKAFSYIRQAYQLSFDGNRIFLAHSLFSFGELYMKIEDYPSALNYFRKAFEADNPESLGNRIKTGWDIWVKMEFAEIFSHLQQFDSAWHYYRLFNPVNDRKKYERIYLVSTGECLLLQKNYFLALQNFLQALPEHEKLNDRNQVMRTLLNIAATYKTLGNDSAALQYARKGLGIALLTKARQYTRDGYQIIFSVYDKWDQKDSANFYFREYIAMKDVAANDQTKAKFAAYNYNQQIELLNKEKQLQKEKIKQGNQQKYFLLLGLAGLLLLGFFLFRNILLKRKNEKLRLEHELELQHLENEKTKAELQHQATELEMQALRAQMNPHFIFNSLNSINRFILQNNKTQASEYLTKFSRLVRMILQSSQASLISLESELEALALYLDLESLRFERHFSYKISIPPDMDIEMLKVPPLIIQPYAENAIWHGLMHKEEKGHLDIEVTQQDNNLFFNITDDGIGRKQAAKLAAKKDTIHKSMGLKITADRIAMLQRSNGNETSVTIHDLTCDGRAAGTEVLIKLPVIYA